MDAFGGKSDCCVGSEPEHDGVITTLGSGEDFHLSLRASVTDNFIVFGSTLHQPVT